MVCRQVHVRTLRIIGSTRYRPKKGPLSGQGKQSKGVEPQRVLVSPHDGSEAEIHKRVSSYMKMRRRANPKSSVSRRTQQIFNSVVTDSTRAIQNPDLSCHNGSVCWHVGGPDYVLRRHLAPKLQRGPVLNGWLSHR